MKKLFKLFSITLALVIAFSLSSNAQLKEGVFGVGAMFAGSSQFASMHYALSPNMDVGVGLLYEQESFSSDEESNEDSDALTKMGFQGTFKYFLSKGNDVSPFVGGYISYIGYPADENSNFKDTKSTFNIATIFGAQVFITKGLAIYANLSLGYEIFTDSRDYKAENTPDYTRTTTTISLSGSGVGAVFYFN